jgi:hypothetical protein
MNKTIIMFFTIAFGLAGNFFPYLVGESDLFSGWSILGGVFGGLFGIWIGVTVAKKFE